MMKINRMKIRNFATIAVVITALFFCTFLFIGCYEPLPHTEENAPINVVYNAGNGGLLQIDGDPNPRENISQLVDYGKSVKQVTAIPDEGYYFVKWSDGLTDVARQDTKVTQKIQVTAEFQEITNPVTITYEKIGSGFVLGKCTQTVQYGTSAQPVEARLYDNASQGQVFVKWSDGNTNPIRQDKNLTADTTITAEFGYKVNYRATSNGSIVGETNQSVTYGEQADKVTALPDKGYRFVEWSDGVKTATRQDKLVVNSIDVYAKFEWRDTDNFKYNYNYPTGNYSEDALTLTRGKVDGVTAIVPERDYFTFEGWYLDEKFNTQATDASGANLLGEEIFDNPSRDLYAKWTVKDEFVTSYKVLMVYVTAIDGTFMGNDGQNVEVHYVMNDEVKSVCNELTQRFKDTLNDMLDGLVTFEVDSYFTTKSISEKCFENEKKNICIYANQIPELVESGMLDNYRSVLAVYSFDRDKNLLTDWSGSADVKYATIPLDGAYRLCASWDDVFKQYNTLIGTCVHEFIHTIQCSIACFDYHRALNYVVPYYVTDKLYLLNQFPVDFIILQSDREKWNEKSIVDAWRNSDKAGIPYGYWEGKIYDVIIKPECINGLPDGYGGVGTVDTGGLVLFHSNDDTEPDWWRMLNASIAYGQHVPKGSRTTMFFAKPKNGYKFIGWSDGVQDELRILTNVQENITLIAYFERLSYTVEYIAGEGGRIEGECIQSGLTGERTTYVTAIADEGYRFVGWSDSNAYNDYTNAERRDTIGLNVYDENGKLYFRLGFSVTAIFEKIEE